MTENQEEMLRSVAAEGLATAFIVELLLTQHLKAFPAEHRLNVARTILRTATRTDQYDGMTSGNEEMSELWADVVIRMQSMVENMLKRAIYRIEGPGSPEPELQ